VLLVLVIINFIKAIDFIAIFRIGGDINYNTFIDIYSMWCIGIPLTFIAVKFYHFNLVEAYIVTLFEELIKVILVIHPVHKKHWLRNRITL